MRDKVKKFIKTVLAARAQQNRQTDRQTNSLTPYTGCVDFFLKLNLLPPYSLRSQGDKTNWCVFFLQWFLPGHCLSVLLVTLPTFWRQLSERRRPQQRYLWPLRHLRQKTTLILGSLGKLTHRQMYVTTFNPQPAPPNQQSQHLNLHPTPPNLTNKVCVTTFWTHVPFRG